MLALEGLSLDETAAVVGGTANAIGVRLHRARAALLAAVTSLDVPQETP
jgi:DNA-directed RNA polymerase specialized sigma24 family protein